MPPRGRPKAQKVALPATPVPILPGLAAARAAPEPAAPAAGRRKKPKTAFDRIKGRKGAMEVFNSLPLDLIYEICSNLDPPDLFALSTTSKIFRAVVTGPSSKPLWIGSRAKVGLPELELPLTDLQYAQLLFGRGCTFCERKNAGKPDPFIRARICGACYKSHFANTSTQPGVVAVQKATNDKLHPLTFLCCKPTNSGRYGPSFYLPEIARMSAMLYEKNFGLDDQWRDRDFANLRRHRLPDQEEREPTTPFQKWYVETDGPRKARLSDGEKINVWIRSQDKEKAANKDEVRKAKYDDLKRRFELQGFVASELEHWEFQNDPVLRKPDTVTARTWPRLEEALKPKLLDLRRRARKAEFSNGYYMLKRTHSESKSFPAAEVFYGLPTIKGLLDNVGTYIPPADLWQQNLDAILNDFKVLLRARREAMVRSVVVAYSALRSAQNDEKAGKHVASGVKGLHYTSVTLPRLPPWIPRDKDAPIVASDEQIATFLDTSPLAFFECTECQAGYNGSTILGHLGQTYGCHSSVGSGQQVETWAIVNSPTGANSMKCDRNVMLIALKLRQLMDDTPLTYREEAVEEAAATLPKELQAPSKKYSVVLKCECETHSLYTGTFTSRNLTEMYYHVRRTHTDADARPASLSATCDYSPAFRGAVPGGLGRAYFDHRYTIEDDIYASLGLGASMAGADYSDEDGYGSWSEEEERRECIVM
ncbi:hypothetical protein JCM6882_002866 [Rhodosporidiobolus microsporus]